MTTEQKNNAVEAKAAEATVILVELSEAQTQVLTELGLLADRDNIAASAFASAVRGKLQSSIDRAIKAKYEADSRGKKAVSEELEKEIQRGIALKRSL